MASPKRQLWLRLRPHRGALAGATVAAAVAAGAAGTFAWLLGPALNGLLGGGTPVAGLAAAILATAAVKAGAAWFHAGRMGAVAQAVVARLRTDLYETLLRLPPRWYETRHSGQLVARFSSDVGQVELALTQALASTAKDSLQVLALLGVCLAVDARLFALAFVVLPLMVIPVSRFAKALKKTATKGQASLAGLTTLAAEQLQHLPVVQGYRAEPQMLRRFDAEQAVYAGLMRRSLFIRGAFTPTLELLGVLGVALCVALGARAVADEPALAGRLVSFLAAALLMYQPLKALAGTFSLVSQGEAAAARVFEVLDAPAQAPAPAGPPFAGASLKGVRVRYADGRLGLDGLDLEVPKGEVTALVGPSGGGKSTTLAVLLGFVDAEGTVDGIPARSELAWVPQEPVLLSGTVRDNLKLGAPAADDAALWKALAQAHAEAFVRALPKGLDAEVGERGARLSGGQRQRLALARAFVRAPEVLLLDEPTAALDAESEAGVQAGLDALMTGRTTLVAAHRLSTVRRAHRIVVLDGGRCVESGTHDALLARGGVYARLVAAWGK